MSTEEGSWAKTIRIPLSFAVNTARWESSRSPSTRAQLATLAVNHRTPSVTRRSSYIAREMGEKFGLYVLCCVNSIRKATSFVYGYSSSSIVVSDLRYFEKYAMHGSEKFRFLKTVHLGPLVSICEHEKGARNN